MADIRAGFTRTNERQTSAGGRIKLRLREVAIERGVTVKDGLHKDAANASRITRGTGIHYTTVQMLLRHPEKVANISFETVARLCQFLHCTPGDLMEFIPAGTGPSTSLSDAYKATGIQGWS